MDGTDENPCLLVVVIDVNRVWWGERALDAENQELTLTTFVDSIITFCNAHLLINHRNKLAIVACHVNKSQYLYPPRDPTSLSQNSTGGPTGATAETLQLLKMSVKGELSHLLSEVDDREMHAESIIAGALGMALCYINRQEQHLMAGEELQSRILVVKGTEDNSEQYMNIMNAVFTAQKKNIVIDACLFDNDSVLLQQACDVTHGIYLKIPQMSGLLQYLLWVFLPDPKARSKMCMPPKLQVDYRAACFCHRQLIDRGYVCSVCLSIFCDFQAICSTCRVPFKILGGPVLKRKVKKT